MPGEIFVARGRPLAHYPLVLINRAEELFPYEEFASATDGASALMRIAAPSVGRARTRVATPQPRQS